ncbi:hypothetical protein ANN_26959 [Periplaneta americana]|uniref:Uncharacterized protein n=1 Tax=Periplaneta americana TaxID=6978 RepID=A0ABQ8RX85_PERAM|nr:hypothetical protein ANN_26959 [Periplaneta americana]
MANDRKTLSDYSDKRAFNIESHKYCRPFAQLASRFSPPSSARPSVKYHRTPVVEGDSKRCFRFSTVNLKVNIIRNVNVTSLTDPECKATRISLRDQLRKALENEKTVSGEAVNTEEKRKYEDQSSELGDLCVVYMSKIRNQLATAENRTENSENIQYFKFASVTSCDVELDWSEAVEAGRTDATRRSQGCPPRVMLLQVSYAVEF